AELNNLNLGTEVTLSDPLSHGDLQEDIDERTQEPLGSYRTNTYLGYGRYAEDWMLLARTFLDYENEGGRVTRSVFQYEKPLLRASRDLRIAAAEQIERLLGAIASEANKKVTSLNKHIDKKK